MMLSLVPMKPFKMGRSHTELLGFIYNIARITATRINTESAVSDFLVLRISATAVQKVFQNADKHAP